MISLNFHSMILWNSKKTPKPTPDHPSPDWNFNCYIKEHLNKQMTATLSSLQSYDFNSFFKF